MEQVLFISLLSGLATGVGGLIVIWFGRPTATILSFYLGLATGMMGMVVLADLIPASLQYGSLKHTLAGIIIGILIMLFFDVLLSKVYLSPKGSHQEKGSYRRMGYFMTFAIALHNLPEGIAIGAGFESHVELGIRVALVIALHNIPEGLGVASTLFLGKLPKLHIVILPIATGFFIPIGTVISSIMGSMVEGWISIGLSIAGGAMGYLVIKDIGPESIRLNRLIGQLGIGIGILIMYMVYQLHS